MPDITPGCCPHCGVINREIEAITGPEHEAVGAYMVCESCACVSIYIGHGAARLPDEYERQMMLDDSVLMRAVAEAMDELEFGPGAA